MTIGFEPVTQCFTCKNRLPDDEDGNPTCMAYPDGIPVELFMENVKHDKPYEDDNGIRYEQKK